MGSGLGDQPWISLKACFQLFLVLHLGLLGRSPPIASPPGFLSTPHFGMMREKVTFVNICSLQRGGVRLCDENQRSHNSGVECA